MFVNLLACTIGWSFRSPHGRQPQRRFEQTITITLSVDNIHRLERLSNRMVGPLWTSHIENNKSSVTTHLPVLRHSQDGAWTISSIEIAHSISTQYFMCLFLKGLSIVRSLFASCFVIVSIWSSQLLLSH